MPLHTKILAGLVLALASANAVAAPKDELHQAFVKFMQAHSFHASVTDLKKGEQISVMDFVAPDRYRMKVATGQQTIIIGDAMYMEINTKLTRLPVPVGQITAQFRNENFLKQSEGDMTVQALPDDTIDGEPTRVYAYSMSKPAKTEGKIWISKKSGLPVQNEATGSFMGRTSTTRIRYSNFDDPSIHIDIGPEG